MIDVTERPGPEVAEPYLFNIGLNRAGTTSLAASLEILGIKTVHWRCGPACLVDTIRSNIERGLPLLAGPDKEFRAFSDFAGHYSFKALNRCYPGSRFSLTTRDLERWLMSREKKVRKNRSTPGCKRGFVAVDRDRLTYEYHVAVPDVPYLNLKALPGPALSTPQD